MSLLSHTQFISKLGQHCSDKKTGTLFIVTAAGTSATISLQDGLIVSLAHRNHLGLAALEGIKQIDHCKLKFSPNVIIRVDSDLPPTADILDKIRYAEPTIVAPAEPAAPAAFPQVDYSDIVNVAKVKKLASVCARRLFGQVEANMVEKKLSAYGLNTSMANIQRALLEVVEEIDHVDKAQVFVSEVFQQLRKS